MAVNEIVMRARWEYDSSQLEKMKADVDAAKDKIKRSSGEMEVSYKSLAMNISHLATAGLSLQSTWERVAAGQMSVAEGAIRSIPALISLASSIWTVVGAETARSIAHSIAHALSGPAGWAILAGAVGAAAVGIALASRIPRRHSGGDIWQSGPYNLLAGEHVLSPEQAAIYRTALTQSFSTVSTPVTHSTVVHIHGFAGGRREAEVLGDILTDKLRRLGIG